MKIGVLALQGAFLEHRLMIERLGETAIEIRQKKDLNGLDGIILPGGESTVQGKLLKELDMFDSVKDMISDGLPTMGTCAGMILLSAEIESKEAPHLGTLPVRVRRNAYDRQLGSFETTGNMGTLNDLPMVFIRAPFITEVSDEVSVLSKVDGNIVAVEYQNQLAMSFHPELTADTRVHEYFLQKVRDSRAGRIVKDII